MLKKVINAIDILTSSGEVVWMSISLTMSWLAQSVCLVDSSYPATCNVISPPKWSHEPITSTDHESQPRCHRGVTQSFTVSSRHDERRWWWWWQQWSAIHLHALCSTGIRAYVNWWSSQTAWAVDGANEERHQEQSKWHSIIVDGLTSIRPRSSDWMHITVIAVVSCVKTVIITYHKSLPKSHLVALLQPHCTTSNKAGAATVCVCVWSEELFYLRTCK